MLFTIFIMENFAEKILTDRFIEEELTTRIHEILGRKYTVPVLEYLGGYPEGVGFRELDVEAVGRNGSSATTKATLDELIQVGWVEHENRLPYHITPIGREALAYAKSGESLLSGEKEMGR